MNEPMGDIIDAYKSCGRRKGSETTWNAPLKINATKGIQQKDYRRIYWSYRQKSLTYTGIVTSLPSIEIIRAVGDKQINDAAPNGTVLTCGARERLARKLSI